MSMGIVIPSGDTLPLEEREFTGLGDYQAAVGGFIAPVDIEDRGITVYVNDEGIVMGLPINARATIGQVGNVDQENVNLGKAGRKRHMGVRPTVRGSVMNPCDHPHGGGEGKSPIGKAGPVTPWGKPTLGYKTRHKKNKSDKFIVKRRYAK